MEQYYMVIDGRRLGPFPLSELTLHGLKPDTLVWRPGMQTWEAAHTLPELTSALMPPVEESAFGTYAEPVIPPPPAQPQNYYGNPPTQPPYGAPVSNHYNWMPWAIVGTVLSFLFSCVGIIFGIIAINNAGKANRMFAQGYEQEGIHANSTAKTMTIIALVLGGLGLIGFFGVWIFGNPFSSL